MYPISNVCIINNNKKLNYDLILLKRFYLATNKYNDIGHTSLLFTSLVANCDALNLSNYHQMLDNKKMYRKNINIM